jgi:hypothetical protein
MKEFKQLKTLYFIGLGPGGRANGYTQVSDPAGRGTGQTIPYFLPNGVYRVNDPGGVIKLVRDRLPIA